MEVFNDLKTTLLLTIIVMLRTKLLGIATIMQIAFNSTVVGLIIRNGLNKNILWCLIASLLYGIYYHFNIQIYGKNN